MIIAVVGPTGIGKTKLSILLAKKYNAIVINCDAMQVYKEMNIGTAKIKETEKEGIIHYLFDIKSIKDSYSVYDYQKDIRKILAENKNKNIIIVGGTGLYLKAALYDYELKERNNYNSYENYTNEELYELVIKKDINSIIHINNRRRMINFLNRDITDEKKPTLLYNAVFIGLTIDRAKLYSLVEDRVDKMIKEGLIKEVKALYDQKINSIAVNTAIGYKELYQYFAGNLSIDEAINLIKKNTRHYIKRQYTWFKNQMDIKWFNVNINNFDQTYLEIINYLKTLNK